MGHSVTDSVARFLAAVPRVQGDEDSPLPAALEPSAAAWRETTASFGVPCPPELEALGEAHRNRELFITPWRLLLPRWAGQRTPLIQEFASKAPCLEPMKRMVPLFSGGGDLLLLGPDGAIYRWSVGSGDPYDDFGVVAPTLRELLFALAAHGPTPALWNPPSTRMPPRVIQLDINGVEYSWSYGHFHEQHEGKWRCVTMGMGELFVAGTVSSERAPVEVRFVGDPVISPRMERVGIVRVGDRKLDLGREGRRFIALALERGWTGKRQKLTLDGWETLSIPTPVPTHAF